MLRDTFDRRDSLPEKGAPSGPCVPGWSKLFVNVDGDFFPCERVSELSRCMVLGNVRDGIDYEAARRRAAVRGNKSRILRKRAQGRRTKNQGLYYAEGI